MGMLRVARSGECVVLLVDVDPADDGFAILGQDSGDLIAHDRMRVGMRRELHAVRESLHRSSRWLDTVGYAILRDEWSPS